MKTLKMLMMSFLMLAMVAVVPNTILASTTITQEEEGYISEVLSYYANYTQGDFNADNGWSASAIYADVDIDHSLTKLEEINPRLGKAYRNIMDTWMYADTTMPINKEVLPDGLANDESLCIVTLGFQLDQKTGEMQPELIDRLNVTLESAKKYPNASIVVTGGGTSPANPNNTEGGEMAKWLIKNGVSEERIIVEDRAPTTVGNAIYTFELLKQRPHIKSVAMISSASHIQRAVAIFETVFQLEAYKQNNDSIKIVSNASCPVERKERLSQQVSAVKQATNYCLQADAKVLEDIERSTLKGLEIETAKDEYELGEVADAKVIATFAKGDEVYRVDVSDRAVLETIDTSKLGKQSMRAMYMYNDGKEMATKDIVVVEKEEVKEPEQPVKPEVKPETPEVPNADGNEVPPTGDTTNTNVLWAMVAIAGVALLRTKFVLAKR